MKTKFACALLGLLGLLGAFSLNAQTVTALRATELRADKLGSAPVLQALAAGAPLTVASVEGGWVRVTHESPQGLLAGWVRASAVNLPSGASAFAGLADGRQAGGNTVMTLGVRSLQPRVSRHALIIGVGRYADPAIPPLPGAAVDRVSATQMATAMQVPASNITYLQDERATGDNIRAAISALSSKVQEGDRVFIHYSGHGTRFNDPVAGGCVEALLAHDVGERGTLTNREMTSLLQSITSKTDKLFVMYDACHSGGLVNFSPAIRTRGLANSNDEGLLRPKFASISEECGRPVNVKTRNLMVELNTKGALPQDIVHIAASRDNEVSFDDEAKGGLATQFMRDCMLRDAVDLDRSGAVSMDEIRQCAQVKINKRLENDANFKAHNLVLSGNAAFVPTWFSQPQLAGIAAAPSVAAATPGAATIAAAAAPALTGEQALRQMFNQRDAKRRVQVDLAKTTLRIGQDTLDLSVTSDKSGYVYLALAGSDNKSVYMLFPNDLDQDNKIDAGKTLQLPRANWRVRAGGPVGNDHLLVMVTDGPRDLSQLAASKVGPCLTSMNDADGRARLGALMSSSQQAASPACQSDAARKNSPACSDAYGASLVTVEEIK